MDTQTAAELVAHGPNDGEAIWTVGFLAVLKLPAEQTDGRVEVAEFTFPGGYSPPLHLHHDVAESFTVLEGTIRFQCGDEVKTLGPGGFVSMPAGVPHCFYVESEGGARELHTGSPGGLWDFHAAAGHPAPSYELPPAEPMDIAALTELAAQHGTEILGPPPGPVRNS